MTDINACVTRLAVVASYGCGYSLKAASTINIAIIAVNPCILCRYTRLICMRYLGCVIYGGIRFTTRIKEYMHPYKQNFALAGLEFGFPPAVVFCTRVLMKVL